MNRVDPASEDVQPLGDPTAERTASTAVERPPVTADEHVEQTEGRTVRGERAIPSVNRERSIQSRISNGLALGTITVLGVAFLAWYYSTQFSRSRDAEAAARKTTAARAAGEFRLPPLGRVDPPSAAVAMPAGAATPPATGDVFDRPPPPAPATTTPAGSTPPPKTPAQLALERKLGAPVLQRGQTPAAPPTTVPPVISPQSLLLDAAYSGLPMRNAGGASLPPADAMTTLLQPTPTPAVAAQMLPTRRFLLPKGAFIDCTLETAIDSTYPGMTTCIGAQDVYSADGKVVLLERGTKYVGEQKGEARLGQSRVFVLWNEARTPTGVVVNLASPGTDELGRSGLPGRVDTHFWDRFGAAILISVIDGTLQALAASQQSGNGAVVLNPQGGGSLMTEVLKSTVAIPPTVVKHQGDRIQVLVARDVDFRSVYALRRDGNAG